MGTLKNWSPLWGMIVDSSIWDEPDYVFRVWIAMLSLKDHDHIVRLTAYQLSSRMRWGKDGEVRVLDAWKILSSPDTRRVEPQEFEGRRIQAVEEGWFMLNGDKYRDMVQLEMKRARNRRAQKAYRNRQNLQKTTPLAGEGAAVKAYENGEVDENFEPSKTKTEAGAGFKRVGQLDQEQL